MPLNKETKKPKKSLSGATTLSKSEVCPRRVMIKALLSSLLVVYHWERYEPPYPPNYGLNSTTTVLLEE